MDCCALYDALYDAPCYSEIKAAASSRFFADDTSRFFADGTSRLFQHLLASRHGTERQLTFQHNAQSERKRSSSNISMIHVNRVSQSCPRISTCMCMLKLSLMPTFNDHVYVHAHTHDHAQVASCPHPMTMSIIMSTFNDPLYGHVHIQ